MMKNTKINHKDNYFKNIKSKYILKRIFENIIYGKLLKIIIHNKFIQSRINIGLNDYIKYYGKIETEIITTIDEDEDNKEEKYYFINIKNKKFLPFYHIYFNNSKIESKKTYVKQRDKIKKIKIILDYEFNELSGLFDGCECIQEINFIKFKRYDIKDMSEMFSYCSSLIKINLGNFKTNKVTNLRGMFSGCSSLIELNLNNFNTNNVTNMSYMFNYCSSLKELNVSNFNTNNVTNMSYMFCKCSSIKKLNLVNFNTNNVKDMLCMFEGCSSLDELNINSFNFDNIKYVKGMFWGCSKKLKNKIKNQNKELKNQEAFD